MIQSTLQKYDFIIKSHYSYNNDKKINSSHKRKDYKFSRVVLSKCKLCSIDITT